MPLSYQDRLAKAVLAFAETSPVLGLTPQILAKKAGVPQKAAESVFKNKTIQIQSVVQYVDRNVEQKIRGLPADTSFQERLFEISLTRFDCLEIDRPAHLALAEQARRAPVLAIQLLGAQKESFLKQIAWAKRENRFDTPPHFFPLYFILMHATLNTWRLEATARPEKWMAVLDGGLRRIFRSCFDSGKMRCD